jgi:hypothetical protein
VVYYPTKNSDGRGVGRLEEVRLDSTRKMRLTPFGQVVGDLGPKLPLPPLSRRGAEAVPVAAGQKKLGRTGGAANLGSKAKGSAPERGPGRTLPTPTAAVVRAAKAAKAKSADPGPRRLAPDSQGSDPQVLAVKKAVLEAASALKEVSHRARPGVGKPATGAAKASTEARQQGRAGSPGKEETFWTGFRETYRRRAKSDGPTPEKEENDARGTKRKAAPGSRRRKAATLQPARSESSSESEDDSGGEEWTKKQVLQAIRDATELKYEKKIDWSDVPGCRQYSLTKKEYSARMKSLNKGGRRVPSEAGVSEVMGNWSGALKELGMKRHGIGALV